ncbi:DUF3099 domain-containing protein [Crossiella sp. CA198]|uniref:DUF3099 domain-containing protein n=1 Tax=Crossiella sp. CA198 TaxID=3455607 RepID=UPI003F8D4D02
MTTQRDGTPVLITEAQQSYEDQLATRKRKYMLMMSLRIPCLVAAAACYQIPWLAIGLVLLSVPLPWMAVLIANDRPPRKAEKVNRFRRVRDDTAIESKQHPVIEG